MKILEITENQGQARVKSVTGDEVEIDQGDGTTVTIDTKKRPELVSRDEKGNLSVDTEPQGNSAMSTAQRRARQKPRSGERVSVNNEN